MALETTETETPETPKADLPQPEEPKKSVGRPREDGMSSEVAAPVVYHPIPSPRYRKFNRDSPNRHQNSKAAWRYWCELPEWAKANIDAYVYRDHPVLLEPPVDENGRPKYFSNIDKIPGDMPIQDDTDLLNRYGCGSYRVILSETAAIKKGDKSILQVWVPNLGGGEYRSNPPNDPRVTDLDQIDKDHPANRAYLSYLRVAGKMNGGENDKRKEEDMAQVQIMESLLTQNRQLTDKLTTREDRPKEQVPYEAATRSAIDVVADSAKRGNEIVTGAFNQAKEMLAEARDAARPTGPASDPMAMALQIVQLITESKGTGSEAQIEALRGQISQLQMDQVKVLQEQVKTLLEAKVTAPAVSASPFASMKEGLESLRQMKAVVDDFAGSAATDASTEPIEAAVEAAAPKWVSKYVLPYLPIAASAIQAWLQSRQQAQYYPPAAPYPMAATAYPPPPYPGPAAYPYAPPPPMPRGLSLVPPTAAPPDPNAPAPPAPLPPQVFALLSEISSPLSIHLFHRLSGSEFAEWFIRQYSEPVYREVVANGVEDIMATMGQHPMTAPLVKNVAELPEFLAEFCNPLPPEDEEEDKGSEPIQGGEPQPA